MKDFFSSFNLVYIIGIISAVVGGLWAFYRFIYEKKLEKFKQANSDLFKTNKQEVLAAIATLGVFKKGNTFNKNTIDVLLSKLYTETDYDITNAIANALIQFSNRADLTYIAREVLDINRNFYIQEKPHKDMMLDLEDYQKQNNNLKINPPQGVTLEEAIAGDMHTIYLNRYAQLKSVQIESTWHSQITADTYGRIIRKAANLKINKRNLFLNFCRQVLLNWDFYIYTSQVKFELYQNIFAYAQLVQFKTANCAIQRSCLDRALIADVFFNHINDIFDSTFRSAAFINCTFKNGNIRQSIFLNNIFRNVDFINVCFEDIYFANGQFNNCRFINCTGLEAVHFAGATLNDVQLPENISSPMENLTSDIISDKLYQSKLSISDQDEIFNTLFPPEKKEIKQQKSA